MVLIYLNVNNVLSLLKTHKLLDGRTLLLEEINAKQFSSFT